MIVKGIERFRPANMPEHPVPGESIGILLPDADLDEIRSRLAAGERLYVVGPKR